MATTPAGWDSSWGTYTPGTNDFATQKAKAASSGDTAAAAKIEQTRNAYIDSSAASGKSTGGTKSYDYNKAPTTYGGGSSSGGTGGYTHSATDTIKASNTVDNTKTADYYSNQTKQALNDYYSGKLTYDQARAQADLAEANLKALVESQGGTYNTTDAYSGFLYGAINDSNGYYANQGWGYLEGVNEPVKENDDGTYTARYSGDTYIAGTNGGAAQKTASGTGGTSSTTSSTSYSSSSTTPSSGTNGTTNTTTVTKNTYTSPWTKREYEYSTTEELEQAMAIDNAYYEQQIADQKAAEVEAQRQEALKLATEQKIADLNATYNNSVSSYNQQAAEAAYRAAQAGDNTRLALASSGDLGGIGQKQYSDERNSYDQSYLQLVIEQQNYYNEIQQAIADARYEGDIELANAIADAAEDKLNAYQDAVDNYYNNYIANSDRFYDRNVTDRNFAYQVEQDALDRAEAEKEYNYNKALQKLQLGTLDATDMEALGLSANDAEYWANYYRTLANYDLAEAQAGMDSLVNGSKSSYSGKSGDDEQTIYQQLYNMGATDADSAKAFLYQLGYKDSTSNGLSVSDIAESYTNKYLNGAYSNAANEKTTIGGKTYYYVLGRDTPIRADLIQGNIQSGLIGAELDPSTNQVTYYWKTSPTVVSPQKSYETTKEE